MGNEGSKDARRRSDYGITPSSTTSTLNSNLRSSQHHSTFPNEVPSLDDVHPWCLLHQCSLHQWKHGHAESANFHERVFSCERVLNKDCSPSFCINKQSIININKSISVFSFHRKLKFSKMAEHFEYNHIPAQMSSVNNFRVKRVLCAKDSLVILQLSQNDKSQFGLLDMTVNKFRVFGKKFQEAEFESISVSLSPDNSKCLMHRSNFQDSLTDAIILSVSKLTSATPSFNGDGGGGDGGGSGDLGGGGGWGNGNINNTNEAFNTNNTSNNFSTIYYTTPNTTPNTNNNTPNNNNNNLFPTPSEILLFDMKSMNLLTCIVVDNSKCHFSFDPRFSWHRISITNFSEIYTNNTLSIVDLVPPVNFTKSQTFLETNLENKSEMFVFKEPNKFAHDADDSNRSMESSEDDDWLWTIIATNHHLSDPIHHTYHSYDRRSSSSSSSSSWEHDPSTSSQPPTSLQPPTTPLLPPTTPQQLTTSQPLITRFQPPTTPFQPPTTSFPPSTTLFQRLVDLCYSRDGRLIVATFLDDDCSCHQRHRRNLYQVIPSSHPSTHSTPINCSLFVYNADSAQTLRCVSYKRYICALHTCPTNYLPLFSVCGSRIALGMDDVGYDNSNSNNNDDGDESNTSNTNNNTNHNNTNNTTNNKSLFQQKKRNLKSSIVRVYSLPPNHNSLQALCRCAILCQAGGTKVKLPSKIIDYLNFCPEFNR